MLSVLWFALVNVLSVLSTYAGGGLSFGRRVHGSGVKVGRNSCIDMYGKCDHF